MKEVEMRGRKPQADFLRLVKNARKPKKTKAKPAIDGMLARPEFLSGEAAAEWNRIVPILYAKGYCTALDTAVLAGYCCSWERWLQAERALAGQPLVIETSNGNMIQHPLVGIANRAAADVVRFASEIGATPISRARITPTPPPDEDDPSSIYFDY